jgi:hypothetical protein
MRRWMGWMVATGKCMVVIDGRFSNAMQMDKNFVFLRGSFVIETRKIFVG